jgi:hypothetical protein
MASARRLVRAAIAGGSFSGCSVWAVSVRVGAAATAAAEVRRKRRRVVMSGNSVRGESDYW